MVGEVLFMKKFKKIISQPVVIKAVLESRNSLDHTLSNLQTSLNGLPEQDVKERLISFGNNDVVHDKAPSVWLQLLLAFKNPFIFVLLALALVRFFTDYLIPLHNGEETSVSGITIILVMVLLSGVLSFWQEYRSNKAAQALKSMISTTATVVRRSHRDINAEQLEVPIKEVVPGDIILLSAGDMVPADVRLIESRDLFISQAVLTGESIPVEKSD
ncbi:Cation transport ATPase, partial [Snodgrassella alvi SCGC AB-598-O11]